jgi:Right handed beta helix region
VRGSLLLSMKAALGVWFRLAFSALPAVSGLLLSVKVARAADYYVDTKGSDSNPGTLVSPFASLQKGVSAAGAGDTVYVRGGTYKIVNGASDAAGVTFSKSGTSDTKRIQYFAYQGELPIFDFSGLKLSATATSAGFLVTGSFLHFKGLEIMGVPEPGTVANNGIWVKGANNDIFELLNLHHNAGPGLSIANGTGGHLILNTDSHDNYDSNSAQGQGQNADGFGCHYQATGPSTEYRGCRAWWNSDDGYDLISQEVPVKFSNCWAMGNGYIDSGTARPKSGNGNGFKLGSSKTGIRHVITNSVAWKNTAAGFYANHSSGGNDWLNNTAYNNGTQFNLLASPSGNTSQTIILSGDKAHKMRNNVGYPNNNTNMGGVDTASNTWDLGLTVRDADFQGVSDAGFMGPRQADGSLPNLPFMKLSATSQLIDKGVDVKLPFTGAKPDLGAYEYGAVASAGSGGGSAAGGAGGGAGSSGGEAPLSGTSGGDSAGGVNDLAGAPGGGALSMPGGGAAPIAGNASTQPSAGSSGQAANDTPPPDAASCGCRLAAAHRTSSGLLFALLAGLALGFRRRR